MNSQRIELLKKFITEEPDNPFNTYALAMEYYESDSNESLKLLRSLLANHPDYLPSYFKAAHLFWEFEKWELADTTFINGIALAEKKKDQKTLNELKSSYQNFQFEKE